jgi:iron only hydrogenase large subunit-like protein
VAETAFQTIQTVPERCRVCYTCVRECPAKAIRILDGQAKVIHERCIGCGNCVRVCSQNAKEVVDSIPRVEELLADNRPVAAVIAPSFPADFAAFDEQTFVGMIKALGFNWVSEVAFGADLVARKYSELLGEKQGSYIATSCPAVVMYVEKYAPELVDKLAPVVSPMVAQARVMRKLHGDNIRVVFVGPCTAKKSEGMNEDVAGEVDCVLTFLELKELFAKNSVAENKVTAADFDAPRAGLGALFPLCGGLLQAADLKEDLVSQQIVTANGTEFTNAIKDFSAGKLEADLIEMLACSEGCIIGAGMQQDDSAFCKRGRVSKFVRENIAARPREEWEQAMQEFSGLDLGRKYRDRDQRVDAPDDAEIKKIFQSMGKYNPEDELNCGACGYESCREHATAIHKGLAEDEMCLPFTIDKLNQTVKELAHSQETLMQSERLASMGQLAAGIAHEVNNPLGVVLMYAHLLLDAVEDESQVKDDIKLIAEQADRCRKIVSGLLHFARQNKVCREMTDIRKIVDSSKKAVVNENNIELKVEHEDCDPMAEVDASQLQQVLTNLISNAFAAMPDGGSLTLRTGGDNESVIISVTDTGTGISDENIKRIFEPFFTTKQIGKGTGLGLAVVYGVVKMHRGNIRAESNCDPEKGPTGTKFIVTLPRKENE